MYDESRMNNRERDSPWGAAQGEAEEDRAGLAVAVERHDASSVDCGAAEHG